MDGQNKAMKYLQEVEPDVLMIAWPCGPWSPLQNISMRTEAQRLTLQRNRLQARRTVLSFTRRAALWQRRRGGLVFGENPATSKAWKTPEIEEAFDGLAHVQFDQCQVGLAHPTNHMPMRKRTIIAGEDGALTELKNKMCPGRKAVEFAHRQQGHPTRASLTRMLKLGGASQDALRYASKFHCSVCAARQAPRHPKPSTVSTRPFGFNVHLHLDLKYLYDSRKKKYVCLSILDLGTIKHDAIMLKNRRSDYVAEKFWMPSSSHS